MNRKTVWALALSASVAALLASPAQAGMLAGAADPDAGASPLLQQAQVVIGIPGLRVGVGPGGPFFFGGHEHCWYDDGWHGPGWYWCGYGYRNGYGWGGGEGYNGWGEHRHERDWHPGPGGHPGPGPHPGNGPHHPGQQDWDRNGHK